MGKTGELKITKCPTAYATECSAETSAADRRAIAVYAAVQDEFYRNRYGAIHATRTARMLYRGEHFHYTTVEDVRGDLAL